MCGLVGLVSRESAHLTALDRAQQMIAHRGPDDRGSEWWTRGDYCIGMASRRLAIQDLTSAGHMPMASQDRSVWLTYNGEVYNFQDLRDELVRKGYTFRSTGDTEVLIALYQEEGVDFIKRLNGIFAFALWDARKGRLMLGRDRFGIKPMYYHEAGGELWFASEIKALFCFQSVPRTVDPSAIEAALTYLGVPANRTGFRDIYKLLPGHYLLWQDGDTQVRSYNEITFRPLSGNVDEASLVEELRGILERVIRRQMVSDVPVGVFLSGGLDSSAIAAMMARVSNRPVESYTIVYRQQDQKWERAGTEAPYAELVARQIGANHHEILVEPDVVSLLPEIAWHLDEPIGDPAAISTYLICKEARRQLTVLLAGQGADEIMAGYHFYAAHQYADFYQHIPASIGRPLAYGLQAGLHGLSQIVPDSMSGRVLAVRRYADLITRHAYLSPGMRHTAFHTYFSPEAKQALYTPAFKQTLDQAHEYSYYQQLFESLHGTATLNKYLLMDMRTHLPDLILNYTDKLGMAASAEVRVPFLDDELVAFANRLPVDMKLHGTNGKYLFRRAMRGILPTTILRRRKVPFGVPIRGWLRQDLRPLIDTLLSERAVRQRGYFNYPVVKQIIDDSRRSLGTSAHQVWGLLMLELWHRVFIDRSNPLEKPSGV